jgi:hypothetical protein
MITITKQDVYESVTNLRDYFFNGEPITEWTVIDNGISIITEDDFGSTQYNLAWPCVVETAPLKLSSALLATMLVSTMTKPTPTEEVIQQHVTKVNGDVRPCMPMTTIRVTGRFCEGYGVGVEGVVIDSPHVFLIGKSVKVDGRHKHINLYAS